MNTRTHQHPGECFPGSRDCELEETSSAHAALWAKWRETTHPALAICARTADRSPRSVKGRVAICAFAGEATGEVIPCNACQNNARDKVFRCELFHADATAGRAPHEGKLHCHTCDRRTWGSDPSRSGNHLGVNDPWRNLVQIPEPPFLHLNPIRPRAVVTAAVGEEYRRLLDLTRPFLARYALAVDADYLELPQWNPVGYGFATKWQLWRVLEAYERVIFLDCDILARSGMVNLFNETPAGLFGVYDDGPDTLRNGTWFHEEYQRFRASQGKPRIQIPHYCNSGVMVAGKAMRDVFAVPRFPIACLHCSEQHQIAMCLHELRQPVRLLDRKCNWQWWSARDRGLTMFEAPEDAVLHLSGMKGEGRLQLLKDLISHFEL